MSNGNAEAILKTKSWASEVDGMKKLKDLEPPAPNGFLGKPWSCTCIP
jgi:hypothetical protein